MQQQMHHVFMMGENMVFQSTVDNHLTGIVNGSSSTFTQRLRRRPKEHRFTEQCALGTWTINSKITEMVFHPSA